MITAADQSTVLTLTCASFPLRTRSTLTTESDSDKDSNLDETDNVWHDTSLTQGDDEDSDGVEIFSHDDDTAAITETSVLGYLFRTVWNFSLYPNQTLHPIH